MNNLSLAQNNENLQERTFDIMEWGKAMVIDDDQDFQMADLKCVECKNMMKFIKAVHDPICDATNKAHKVSTQARKFLYDRPDQASKIIATKMANYKQKRDAEKAEEQRLLDEKAKGEHDAACEREAQVMEEKGQPEVAEAIRLMKEEAPVTQLVTQPTLMSKTSFKKDWKITNKPKVSEVPAEYLVVDEAALMRTIRAKKGVIQITGVEFKEIDVPIRKGE